MLSGSGPPIVLEPQGDVPRVCQRWGQRGITAERPEMGSVILPTAKTWKALPAAGEAKEAWTECPTGAIQPAMSYVAVEEPAASCPEETHGATVSTVLTGSTGETPRAGPLAESTKLGPTHSAAGAEYVPKDTCLRTLSQQNQLQVPRGYAQEATSEKLLKAVPELHEPTCDTHSPETHQQVAGREHRPHGSTGMTTLKRSQIWPGANLGRVHPERAPTQGAQGAQ